MTQPSFQVDVDGLGVVITRLTTAETAMRDAMQALHSTGGAEMVGTKKLDEACNSFQKSWKYGLDQIHKDIADVLEGLVETKEAYAQIDLALAEKFPPQAAPVPSAPQGAAQ